MDNIKKLSLDWLMQWTDSLSKFTWGAGHYFHIMIRRLPSFNFLDDILYISEAIGQSKFEHHLGIFFDDHFLEVLVPGEGQYKIASVQSPHDKHYDAKLNRITNINEKNQFSDKNQQPHKNIVKWQHPEAQQM